MRKSFIRGTWQQQRAYSPAVITQGADKIIWLAGQGGYGIQTSPSMGRLTASLATRRGVLILLFECPAPFWLA